MQCNFQLIHLLTREYFIRYDHRGDEYEFYKFYRLFDYLPEEWYSSYKDPCGLKRFLVQENRKATKAGKSIRKALKEKIGKPENKDEILVDFFMKMLHPNPSRRMSAEQLLQHSWLADTT